MRRGFIGGSVWMLATGVAVTLSWWGISSVMSGTVYDPPNALNISAESPVDDASAGAGGDAAGGAATPSAPPQPSVTPGGAPSGSASTGPGGGTPSGGSTPRTSASAPSPPASTPPPAGHLKAAAVKGGHASFEIGERSATLSSSTPNAGWKMETDTTNPYVIRVDFRKGDEVTSIICSWYNHAPIVETVPS
ncbi:hypothetical protein ACTVZO_44255 [Streptomyces sp. IBSNAI002]|uniref:hypothetical protein n=1 Tax=Streptomyces sp. IBSNAI002 TaxID=3457500 RepID=UPI003FD12A22